MTVGRRHARQWAAPALVLIGGAALSLVLFGTGARAASRPQPSSDSPSSNGVPVQYGATGTGGAGAGTASGLSPAAAQGQTLFVEACSSCHGADATGTARAPTLTGLGPATVDFWVRTGRMPLALPESQAVRKPPLFDAAQARDIAEYVASLAPGGVDIPRVSLSNTNLAQGGELFRLDCSTCHSFVAAGGALSYGAYAPPLGADSPLDIAEAVRTGPDNMPRFSTAQLTQKQMDDIIRYVKYVTNPEDRGGFNLGHVGPTAEGFVGIVFGVGLLMVAAFWFGDRA
jgi:ubiquinol-cytochrome c reductase cytochrome c subunit